MSHIELLFRGELQSFEQQYRMLRNISLFCILREGTRVDNDLV